MRHGTTATPFGGRRLAPIIGRAGELAELAAALDRAAAGDGGLVVVSGAPGIGKTRLAQEATALARAGGGFQVLEGQAHALSQGRAYGPVADALELALGRLDRGRLVMLVGDLPQLGTIIGGLGLASPEPLGDAALERSRLLDGLVRSCQRLSRQAPLLLLVDDVHDADRGTLEFLHLARRALTEVPVLVLVTRRPDAGDIAALDALTAPAETAGWAKTIQLGALDLPGVRALVEATLGGPVTQALLDAVASRCQGLPLLALSLAHALDDAGAVEESGGMKALVPGAVPLPAAVRDHVHARLTAVPSSARAVLDLLAVADGRLEHAVLAAAAALDREELLDVLTLLEQRELVSVVPGGYAIAHAVLAEAVAADLSPLRAQRCHARLADAVAAASPEDPRIARHLLAAGPLGDPDRALAVLEVVARTAGQAGAGGITARDLEAAAALAEVRGRTDLLTALLEQLGEARELLGDLDGARRSWENALAEHLRSGDALAAAELNRRLALLHWDDGELDRAHLHLDEAERHLVALEPSPVLGLLLHTRAITQNRLGNAEGAAQLTGRLLGLAERFGSPRLAAAAHLTAFVSEMVRTDYLAAAATAERGRLAALAAGDTPLQQRAHDCLALVSVAQGRLADFRSHSRVSLELAVELGAPPLELWPRVRLGIADLIAGRLDAALRTSTETLTMARRLDQRRGLVGTLGAHAWILVTRGQLDQAAATVQEADSIGGGIRRDRNVHGTVDLARVSLALARGEGDVAAACAEEFLTWHQTLPLTAAAVLAEAQLAAGMPAAARATAARIRGVRSCTTAYPRTLGSWIDGLAAAAEGEAAAAEHLAEAETGFEQLGMALAAARARLAWARVAPDRAAAVAAGHACLAAFEQAGSAQDAASAREWLRSRGATPSRGRRGAGTGSELTARQLEIARLVATGLTNAEVAERLFISPRTVTTHLDRMYVLLGLSSRAALTRYLADTGLLTDGT